MEWPASRADDGTVNIGLTNLHPRKTAEISIDIRGLDVRKVTGRVLTASKITAHNTFSKPDAVSPKPFKGVTRKKNTLTVKLPAKSVVTLAIA